MSRRRFVQNGAILSLGQVAGYGLVFFRTWVLTHVISRADVGIAATFQMAVFLFDMLSDLNLGTLLIQAPDGDEPLLQSTAQAMGASRGLLNTLLLAGLAWPIAYVMEVPAARAAYQWLGLVLLLRGLSHLDTYRLQRHQNYRSPVTAEVISQLLAMLAVWPLALLRRDYTVMVWVLLIQAGSYALLSHLLAERRYAWAWEKRYLRRLVSFGWPLLINGFLMFGIFQGDRAILAARRIFPAYSKDDLAIYSVAFSLTLIPTMVLTKVASGLLLPQLSKLQNNAPQFLRRYALMLEGLSMIGGAMAIAFVVAGGSLVVLLYGRGYAAAGAFIGWLGAMQGVRLIRVGTTLGALAQGNTRNSMISNIARSTGIGAAVGVAAYGAPLPWIAAAGFCGEVLALAASALNVRLRHQIPVTSCLWPVLLLGAGLVAAILPANSLAHLQPIFGITCAAAIALTFLAIGAVVFRTIREELWSSMRTPVVRATR